MGTVMSTLFTRACIGVHVAIFLHSFGAREVHEHDLRSKAAEQREDTG